MRVLFEGPSLNFLKGLALEMDFCCLAAFFSCYTPLMQEVDCENDYPCPEILLANEMRPYA